MEKYKYPPAGLEELERSGNGKNGNGRQGKVAPKVSSRKRFWPKISIDLSLPSHRWYLLFCLVCLAIVGLAIPLMAYQGYSYSESSEFCGTTCHTMAPQYTRYEHSLHANVACTDCHVGRGASYYVKSKIDGMRQVLLLFTGNYSRPIKSPLHNLRPARETCEECHTPASFKDNLVKKVTHYRNDEQNTPVVATFILKMGGWQEQTGMSQGIHWHITNPVYYIAADEQRQVMLWVGVKQGDGTYREYFSRDLIGIAQTSFVEKAKADGQIRQMDCIDCHNRTAHEIPPPEVLVDEAILANQIGRDLPSIRAKSVELLKAKYDTLESAKQAIAGLADDYRMNLPQVYQEHSEEINSVISILQQMYSSIAFPEMNLDWQTNPNNENHAYSAGCFRCHDSKHILMDQYGAEKGAISASCNLCHTVPIVGSGSDILVEAPVIVGAAPATHKDSSWTIAHQNISEVEKQDCFQCHGQGFCNNGACHNLEHPPNMLYTHAEEYRKQGDQVCYTCHQDISCSRCHPAGVIVNP
jgi:nitrate/TMAO reductase-like tetraheme cytochrome c subunit